MGRISKFQGAYIDGYSCLRGCGFIACLHGIQDQKQKYNLECPISVTAIYNNVSLCLDVIHASMYVCMLWTG